MLQSNVAYFIGYWAGRISWWLDFRKSIFWLELAGLILRFEGWGNKLALWAKKKAENRIEKLKH